MNTQKIFQNNFPELVTDFFREPVLVTRVFSVIDDKVQKVASVIISAIECSGNLAVHLGSLFVSNHVLAGLCKITGYEILKHGTSWGSYLSILQTGADPRRGGETSEASISSITLFVRADAITQKLVERAKGKFYVTKDTEEPSFFSFVVPIIHSSLTYVKEYKNFIQLDAEASVPLPVLIVCIVASIFTPKVRFIYSLKEVHGTGGKAAIFKDDPDYGGEAYLTSQHLPNNRIGLVGLATHVKKEHVFQHLQSNLGRVVEGVAQLAFGLLITATGFGILF